MKKQLLSLGTFVTALLISSFGWSETGSNTFVQPRPVQSQDELKAHISAFLGGNSPEGSSRTGTEYGIDVGFQPMIPFSAGVEINHNTYQNDNEDTQDRYNLLLKGAYNFGGDIPVIKNSYVGVGAGVAMINSIGYLVSAPMVGFDLPVTKVEGKTLSLGALAKYTIYEGDNPDSFSLSGVVKYWF